MPRHVWSCEELWALRDMWRDGKTLDQIAAHLNRTKKAVDDQRRDIGLPKRRSGRVPWHPVNRLEPGETVFVSIGNENTRRKWLSAAKRSGLKVTTSLRVLHGQLGCRITRSAA